MRICGTLLYIAAHIHFEQLGVLFLDAAITNQISIFVHSNNTNIASTYSDKQYLHECGEIPEMLAFIQIIHIHPRMLREAQTNKSNNKNQYELNLRALAANAEENAFRECRAPY